MLEISTDFDQKGYYACRSRELLMKIIGHDSEQEKAIDSSIKYELNKELEAILSDAAHLMQSAY